MKTPRAASKVPFAIRYLPFAILLISGCAGTARINFISLNTNAIDPPKVEPFRFDAQECFWWLDAAGDFNIAMQCHKGNLLLGKLGDMDINLSFALDGPPAGSGRDYPLRQRETRAVILSPGGNQRFVGHAGIISVILDRNGDYHGSYRVWMSPLTELNVLSFLPQRPGPILCFGTFHAVHDQPRGRAIRDRSEFGGWARPPRPAATSTSAPATPR